MAWHELLVGFHLQTRATALLRQQGVQPGCERDTFGSLMCSFRERLLHFVAIYLREEHAAWFLEGAKGTPLMHLGFCSLVKGPCVRPAWTAERWGDIASILSGLRPGAKRGGDERWQDGSRVGPAIPFPTSALPPWDDRPKGNHGAAHGESAPGRAFGFECAAA
eukprot:4513402-Alexandrium_andersonii.AAC.1